MAYATLADLTPGVIAGRTLVQLTDDLQTGKVNEDIVQEKLDEASGIVELHCRNRYKLPLQPTQELKGMTLAIAAKLLYGRRSGTVPQGVRDDYDDALKFLRDIAASKIGLDQPISQTEQTTAGRLAVSKKPRVFSGRNLDGLV
ncbi:gp436 family protein [Granulicella cerasi]|uniref:Gp436 family protein n=1 Tax=Granulicella cerasi TaxID=741063 RepID=A0ABW1Z7X3_9BACT|nr:DUF1320 domain-containing protein [Granulicella cerasi]